MSKVFYDHLVDLDKVEKKIKKIAKTNEEREELYNLVDEIMHHRVLGCVLDRLPRGHHEEFLEEFVKRPHDANLMHYLKDKIADDVEDFLKEEIHTLAMELLAIVAEKTKPEVKKA